MKTTSTIIMVTAILATFIYGVSFTGTTGKIAGVVTDSQTGEGIPGAAVTVDGTTLGAISGFDGKYVIMNIPGGIYTLTSVTIGYAKQKIENVVVIADSTTTVDMTLSRVKIESEEIIVGSDRYQIEKHDAGDEMKITLDKKDRSQPSGKSDNIAESTNGFTSDGDLSHFRKGRPGGESTYMLDGVNIQYPYCGYYSPPPPPNTESYDRIYENRFLSPDDNPLSTFSIDVDAASYSNTRRFLNQGALPPADAVRIEEFINYFDYDYPQPDGDVPFSITTEVSDCPWKADHRLLHIGLQGKNIPMESIPPGNLVFLLDVSGSMQSPDKLPLLKSAFKLLVSQLRENDRVAIVVYAGASGLVLPSTPGYQKETIINAIERLHAGGSTAGAAGIRLAYETAKRNFIKKGNNRVILATDGDFNVGVSSDEELTRLIEEKRKEGVFLTVLGFGTGNLKDSKMEKLADKGNGNYAYIDNILEAKKILVNELGGTLFTIAKDVKIQIEFNPARVAAYRLVGYENRILAKEDFNDDKKDAGEIGSGHSVTALYEIIPAGDNEWIGKVDRLKYQKPAIDPKVNESSEMLTVKFRYKKPDEDKSRKIEVPVFDRETRLKETSDNFRFSAAAAEFGMLLRDSEFKGDSDYDQVIEMANRAKGRDSEGYRAEFIRLVKLAGELSKVVAEWR